MHVEHGQMMTDHGWRSHGAENDFYRMYVEHGQMMTDHGWRSHGAENDFYRMYVEHGQMMTDHVWRLVAGDNYAVPRVRALATGLSPGPAQGRSLQFA
ncbi:hypothetical protein J6590_020294 [Homalodisca vitripennis]|nr:hypothetical protein J6590_020294 [Homalodisca vitripennis]